MGVRLTRPRARPCPLAAAFASPATSASAGTPSGQRRGGARAVSQAVGDLILAQPGRLG
jgi:hypothetical protein